MDTIKVTKSEMTQEDYLKRAATFVARATEYFRRETVSCCDTVEWLGIIKPSLRKTSWRVYKSCFNFYLEKMRESGAEGYAMEDIHGALRNLAHIDSAEKNVVSHPIRTSSGKKKSVPYADFARMSHWMGVMNIQWHWQTHLWVYATILTGLRPIEWQNALFSESDVGLPILVVRNAKATNGRSHGVSRVLHLEMLDADGIQIIKDHLSMVADMCSQEEIGWDRYYAGVRNALYKTNLELWPNRKCRITLYSARHQFAADAKLAGYTKQEVAAMMGHASDLTAGRHYGKRRSGRKGFSVIPDQEDVARVRSPAPSAKGEMRMR